MASRIATEEIYEAVFDDAAFDQLLGRLAEAIGARSFVAGWHYRDRTATLLRDSGHWSAEQMGRYNHDFAFSDIWNVAVLSQWTPNRAVDMAELVSDREFGNSILYNELFRPMGDDTWRSVAIPAENKWGMGAVAFHRGRSSNGFDSRAVAMLDSYAPHVARLLSLRGKMAAMERKLEAATAVTDALGQAVLLVDGSGRLLQANQAAEAMLLGPGALYLRQDVIGVPTPAADQALKAAIAKALAPADPEPGAVTIQGPSGRTLILSIIAVPVAGGRQALVTATDPEAHDTTLPARLRSLYRLSPGEAAIAIRLAEGAGVADLAEERGVVIDTVRSQVKAVAAKLGCSRQSDIVRIVGSLPKLDADSSLRR